MNFLGSFLFGWWENNIGKESRGEMEIAGGGGIEEKREMEMEIGDMDSLFEGMVLFTPSQLAENHVQVQEQKQDLNQPEPESQNSTQQQKLQHNVQEPLDENLFSDLVVQTPLDQPEPEPEPEAGPPSATAFSRQTSSSNRKKKRVTGFRIGYARDYQIHNNDGAHDTQFRNAYGRDDEVNDNTDAPTSQSSSLHTSTTTDGTISLVPNLDSQSHQSQAQQQQQQQQSINDVEAQFEKIKAQIIDNLSRAHELAASISAARKDSIRRRRKVADDLHLATIRLEDLEKQLEDACEAEDFEAADRINESIAASDKDKQALLTALRDAEAQCNAIDSKMLEALNRQISVEEECASLLHRFSEVSHPIIYSTLFRYRPLNLLDIDCFSLLI